MREELWAEWVAILPWVGQVSRRMAEGDVELEDLLRDAAMDRFESVWDGWLPGMAPMGAWLRYKTRLIMYKRCGAFRRRKRQAHSAPVPERESVFDASSGMEVQYVLERVGSPHAEVLYCRHMLSMTFEELGASLGVSRNTAREAYARAMTAARRVLLIE